MPQMSPLPWINLLFYTLILIKILSSLIYFMMLKKISNNKNFKKTNFFIKW